MVLTRLEGFPPLGLVSTSVGHWVSVPMSLARLPALRPGLSPLRLDTEGLLKLRLIHL